MCYKPCTKQPFKKCVTVYKTVGNPWDNLKRNLKWRKWVPLELFIEPRKGDLDRYMQTGDNIMNPHKA